MAILAGPATAAAAAATTAYVTNFNANTVSTVDIATNTVTATIPVGSHPRSPAATPDGSRVYVVNFSDSTVSVIDTATRTVTATIPVGTTPIASVINPAGTRVYVSNLISSSVSVIDTATNTVIATISGLPGLANGEALNAAGSTLYVVNGNNVSVIDTATNTVTATIGGIIGAHSVAVTPNGSTLYVTQSGQNKVTVIGTATNTVTATIPTATSTTEVVVNAAGTLAYVSSQSGGDVIVIDTTTNTVMATIPTGAFASGLAFTPDKSHLYVANQNTNTVSVIDAATNTVTATVGVGTGPVAVAMSTSGAPAPPRLSKAFGAASVPLNGSTSVTFSVANPNSSSGLTGVGFTDTLPAGLVVASPDGLTGGCGDGTITAVAGSGSVSLSGASLGALPGPTATCAFAVNVTGTTAGAKMNTTSTVASKEGGDGTPAAATLTVVAPPSITKAFGAATIPLGGSTSLGFTVSDPAGNVTLTGVGFTDTLPAGLVVAAPNGLTGSCGGGTITATAGSGSVTLAGATVAAGASCTFAVNVTTVAIGAQHNTTSTVNSTEGGTGPAASASVTVVRAPTTVTVAAAPPSADFGSPVTFTGQVAPAQANGSGTAPTGTVSFYIDGQATPAAAVPINGSGQASFTTSGLGAGSHTVVAVYGGDQNFLGSTSSTAATVAVTCQTTVTGGRAGSLTLGPGSTCIAAGAHITGSVIVRAGAAVDIEGATIDGPIDASAGPSTFRLCGSNVGGAVTVKNATGFVLAGDPGDDACPSNTIHGSLSLKSNAGGVEASGNHVAGAILTSGNSGTGPFAEDTGPDITGNGP